MVAANVSARGAANVAASMDAVLAAPLGGRNEKLGADLVDDSLALWAAAWQQEHRAAAAGAVFGGLGIGKVQDWLTEVFGDVFAAPDGTPTGFAPYHDQYWQWLGVLRRGMHPRPFIAVWPRGAGKSTCAEVGCVLVGAAMTRTYVWYVSGTQEQADRHVESVADLLERPELARRHPLLAERMVGKYGSSKGWRRNRIRCRTGFTVDAMGLDSAARGVKVGKDRPDLMIIDDVDDRDDSAATTRQKLSALAFKVLPAGSGDCGVIGAQNLVTHTGVFAHLANLTQERTDVLADRIVSGPHPALENFSYETQAEDSSPESGGRGQPRTTITTGTPTWDYMSLAWCQALVDRIGIDAFRAEMQHEDRPENEGIWRTSVFRRLPLEDLPWDQIVAGVTACDPAVSSTKRSDCQAVQTDLLAADRTIYRVSSWERVSTPVEALRRALRNCFRWQTRTLVIETDQGGDLWESEYRTVVRQMREDGEIPLGQWLPKFTPVKAGALGASKVERWSRMALEYQGKQTLREQQQTSYEPLEERPRIIHVVCDPEPGERDSPHVILERALRRLPLREPFDLGDAAFWSWFTLRERPALFPMAQGYARGRFLAPHQERRPDSAPPALPPPSSWSGRIPVLPPPRESGAARESGIRNPDGTLRIPRLVL